MKKWQCIILTMIMMILFVGCSGSEEQEGEVKTFKEWSKYEVFAKVPALITDRTRIKEAHDAGDESYVIEVTNTVKEDYQNYLKLLEKNGFKKYADNGESGVDNTVFTSTYTKKDLVLTVTFIESIRQVFVSASENQPLSERLFYKDEYVSENKADAKTTLHMVEMFDFGNSFVIQLKNGHFIVCDGGEQEDMIYLLEYLEKLAPQGQKPVIEAWFISHGHLDHIGCFLEVAKNAKYAERVIVEGFYFSKPNAKVSGLNGDTANVESFLMAARVFRDETGERTPIYRTFTGERYYFSDISIEIVFGQEIFQVENSYAKVFNDTSSWMMLNIEGQKVLMPGDADALTQATVARIYSEDYLDVDILQVFHHGYNMFGSTSDKYQAATLMYPFFSTESDLWRSEAKDGNKELQEAAVEYFSYADGTKVLTFPYKIGTYQSEPPQTWAHHPNREERQGVQ